MIQVKTFTKTNSTPNRCGTAFMAFLYFPLQGWELSLVVTFLFGNVHHPFWIPALRNPPKYFCWCFSRIALKKKKSKCVNPFSYIKNTSNDNVGTARTYSGIRPRVLEGLLNKVTRTYVGILMSTLIVLKLTSMSEYRCRQRKSEYNDEYRPRKIVGWWRGTETSTCTSKCSTHGYYSRAHVPVSTVFASACTHEYGTHEYCAPEYMHSLAVLISTVLGSAVLTRTCTREQ